MTAHQNKNSASETISNHDVIHSTLNVELVIYDPFRVATTLWIVILYEV